MTSLRELPFKESVARTHDELNLWRTLVTQHATPQTASLAESPRQGHQQVRPAEERREAAVHLGFGIARRSGRAVLGPNSRMAEHRNASNEALEHATLAFECMGTSDLFDKTCLDFPHNNGGRPASRRHTSIASQ